MKTPVLKWYSRIVLRALASTGEDLEKHSNVINMGHHFGSVCQTIFNYDHTRLLILSCLRLYLRSFLCAENANEIALQHTIPLETYNFTPFILNGKITIKNGN